MRILELELNNFGVYRGANAIPFGQEKPVILIGGLNGRGKTTLLEAVLVALYGANSSAYEESRYTTFGSYLRAHTNTDGGETRASVKLTFLHQHDGISETLSVKREWDVAGSRVYPFVTVRKNKKYDQFLTDNWSSYVEEILPRALSSFFFFDGEKVAELALDGSDSQIRESIRALLGVTTVDSLRRDLHTLEKRVRGRSPGDSNEDAAIEQLAAEMNALQKKLSNVDQEIQELSDEVGELEKQLEIQQTDLIVAGGDAALERARHEERKASLKKELEALRIEMVQFSSGLAPLAMFEHTLPEILTGVRSEHERKVMSEALGKLSAMLTSYDRDRSGIQSFLDYASDHIANASDNETYIASDNSITEIVLLMKEIPSLRAQFTAYAKRQRRLLTEIEEEDNYLSIVLDQGEIAQRRKAIEETTAALVNVTRQIEVVKDWRSHANGEYVKRRAEYKRRLAGQLVQLNKDQEDTRLLQYVSIADDIFERYAVRLQERKVELLAKTITECYVRLANKNSLITRIEMNQSTLELTYFAPDGKPVEQQLLSAGERQLMVIATLWALAKCSGKKLPVMIDTPLARLDSKHRLAIVESYFPYAAEQTIILSTDSEIYGVYYDALKPNICDEYTLVYDDDTRSTSIRRGYFAEALS